MQKDDKRGKYFTLATKDTHKLCEELIRKHHPDLDTTAAKVDIVMAFRDPDGEAPAMEKDGHRIYGKASLIGLKDRVKGMGDCEVMLDGDVWEDLADKVKAAILDHELEHFEVKRDKQGDFILDDLSRPTMKIKSHDRQIGWFDTVARRHGAMSMEIMELQKLFNDEAGQTYLPFLKFPGEGSQRKVTMSVNGGPEVDVTEKFRILPKDQ
jgi:hypothetical protein